MNDLVDHNLTELEFLVFVVDVLGDHSDVRISRRPAVGVSVVVALIIVIVKCGNAGVLADATVSLSTSAVVLPAKVEGLEEQKNWHLDNSQEKQDNLNTSLATVKLLAIDDRTRREEHVNQHVQQTGWRLSDGVPVNAPFVDDSEDQVTEDGLEEDHAGNEVTPDVDRRLEVAGVDVGEAQVVCHVSPTHNDGQLHLVRVREEQVIVGVVPAPIQTEWVCVALDTCCDKSLRLACRGFGVVAFRELPLPHGREQRELLGEDITVDQTSVHGEDSHHEHDVTTVKSHAEEFVLLATLQRLLIVDHGGCSEGHDGTVSEITEHDSEQEREGDDGRKTRVDFGVLGSAVGVNDGLEAKGELVGLVVGGRGLGCLDLVDDGRDTEASVIVHILKRRLDETQRAGRAPGFSDQGLARRIVAEAIESLVDALLLLGHNHPGCQRAANLVELGVQGALGVAQDVGEILKAGVDFVNLVSAQLAVLIDVVDAGAQALRDLADLRDDLLAVREDDEDVLVNLLVLLGVDDGVRDLALVHVQIATQRAPKDTLESAHAFARNDTSDKANVHHAEALLLRIGGAVGLFHVTQQRRVIGRINALPDLFRLS